MLLKKDIETKKSVSNLFAVISYPIVLVFEYYTPMIVSQRRMHLQDYSQRVAIWS